MIIRHYISLLLLCCGSLLFAQDIKVTATISTRQVVTGEPFEITFSVNGNAERFDPPNLSAFQVVGGPNQSQSMSSINGNTSVSIGISYDLVAQKEGTFVIGSATVTVGGHTYTSNPVKVTVVKGSPAQQRAQTQQQQQQQQGQPPVSTGRSGDISKNLFIRAVPDKTHVYQGEQLTVVYKLYTRVALAGNVPYKNPEFNGFWSQDRSGGLRSIKANATMLLISGRVSFFPSTQAISL
jgi:hypothetical protein